MFIIGSSPIDADGKFNIDILRNAPFVTLASEEFQWCSGAVHISDTTVRAAFQYRLLVFAPSGSFYVAEAGFRNATQSQEYVYFDKNANFSGIATCEETNPDSGVDTIVVDWHFSIKAGWNRLTRRSIVSTNGNRHEEWSNDFIDNGEWVLLP